MIEPELLDQILSKDGPTKPLVALRRTPAPGESLQTGVWYSDFARVKAEAAERGLPLVCMWTNGDLCGLCKRFTTNLLDPAFKAWMREQKALFWLGGSMDETEGRGAEGYAWCAQDGVRYFPFVSVLKDGKAYHASGLHLDRGQGAPTGVASIVEILTDALTGDGSKFDAAKQGQPQQKSGGCPGGHPHLKALQEIQRILTPFTGVPVSNLRIRINPAMDEAKRTRFLAALTETGGHCPCRKERTSETACLCAEFMAQAKPGVCKCGFYEKYSPTKEG